ncbi:MAG: ABC transporter substrate-binding protein [SAR324 cluster bacterium]|nr:ABC transporter substrate-binding protein [SAR324 cluster bacterium]
MLLTLPGSPAQAEKKEILIGGTLSKSGRFQGITRPFPKLAEAWANRLNRRGGIYLSKLGKSLPVRFVLYDDQTSPPTALKFYERLATVDKVDVFIGPFSSFLTNAALQASIIHKIPFFMVEANDSVMFEKANRWRATGLAPAQWEYKRHAEFYARKRGVKTFALLSRDNLHENQAMEGFGDWLRKAGFQVVYQNVAPKNTKDFASIILAIKQKKPDVVFIEALPPPFGIGFLKQARELGLNPKDMIVGHAPVPVIKAMGKSMENIVGSMYSFEGSTADHEEFNAITKDAGFAPWQFSESGIRYTAYKRIEDALKRAGSLDHEAVRAAMWATDVTIWGELRIKHDQKGYGTLHPWPTQIKGGKHVSLWPLDKGVKVHEFKAGRW